MLSVNGCTITGNSASNEGGGISIDQDGVVYLKNTSLGANTSANIFGSYIDQGGNTFYP